MFLYIFWDTPCIVFMWLTIYRWTANPFWQIGQKWHFSFRLTWWTSLKWVLACTLLLNFLWHFKHMVDPSSKSQRPSSFGSSVHISVSRKNLDSIGLEYWVLKSYTAKEHKCSYTFSETPHAEFSYGLPCIFALQSPFGKWDRNSSSEFDQLGAFL